MFLNRNNRKIYYEVHGQGAPLLFVHGWMMNTTVWKNQVDHFAKTHRVVIFDLTGYGQSEKPDIKYDPGLWLDDIQAVIAHCNLDKPAFVGWSMGGSLGMGYAVSRPGTLGALVLVDTTPLLVAPPENFEHATPPDEAEQLLGAIDADFSSGARGFVELMLPEDGVDHIKDALHSVTQQTTGPIALESIMAAGTSDLRPVLSDINLPTMVMHGEADMVCKLGAGKYLADRIPHAGLVTFPGKGHVPFLTDAENFNTVLTSFLSGIK